MLSNPHGVAAAGQVFSFAKIWLMYAHFEVRQKDLEAARKILGQAIGRCGKEKIFKVSRHVTQGVAT